MIASFRDDSVGLGVTKRRICKICLVVGAFMGMYSVMGLMGDCWICSFGVFFCGNCLFISCFCRIFAF